MPLIAGSCFGAYEVVSLLGVGGMGEVYRARDSQLKREVALKILPAAVASDPERLARFQREAEILASLNHQHIAHIYGLADSEGTRALIMELVEGETLAEVLARGPMAIDETLGCVKQIADALEAAHDRGVVHRDLKPANIKVTPDGVVKVLDFGLARALDPAEGSGTAASPTITSPAMTRAGVILGTAAYMSPEQARGRVVDARTDVWAFGCVVFELLTGRGAFEGETITDVLGAIVHKEPAWSLLPAGTPERLRRLLVRCLTKDQKQRLHSIADARLEIEDLLASRRSGVAFTDPPATPASVMRPTTGGRVAWALVGASVTALAAAAVMWSSVGAGRPADSPALRVSILHTEGGDVGVPAISPDGRRVAYPARRADGMPLIWVRDLDKPTSTPLAGTEGGDRLFWSPDSKRLGFTANGAMKYISADGGPVKELVRNVRMGGSWGAGDVVIYGTSNGLYKINAAGGQSVRVTRPQGNDWEHVYPSLLPDGRHFLFTAKHWAGLAESGAQGIYVGSMDDPSDTRQLLPELSSAVFVPGYILFARVGQLMASPFDLAALRITGEPIALGEAVATQGSFYSAAISAAVDGSLAIRQPPVPSVASSDFDAELALLNRDGTVALRFGGVQRFSDQMALSPDGRAVAAAIQDARTSASELWRIDVESGARAPLTSMRASGGWTGAPQWSRDGKRLAFACQPPGILDDVCVRDLESGVVTTVVASKSVWEHPVAWSPDGEYMLVAVDEFAESSTQDLRVWSAKTRELSPYVKLSSAGEFSPDARFVAFSSTESGREEVSVTTFPERRQTWPLSTDGGRILSWSADGREILVATLSGHIVAYPVEVRGGSFSAGAPHVLIRNVGFDAHNARATRDHSRILVRLQKDADKDRGEIRLLFGWSRGLK